MRLYKLKLDDMIRSQGFDYFMADRLGNDLFINDADRAERIYEAAEYGGYGSTHQEIIDDWRDYLNYLGIPERCKTSVYAEIDDCEAWHIKNGSIDNQLG